MTSPPSSESPSPPPAVWQDLLRVTDLFRELVSVGMPASRFNRVTLNQARIFAHVVQSRNLGRPVRIKSIARELDVSPAAASQAVERLVAYGVLDRSPDPDDRRAVRLSLTPEGDALFRAHESRANALFDSLDGVCPPEDFAAFRRVLSRLAEVFAARWDEHLDRKHGAAAPGDAPATL